MGFSKVVKLNESTVKLVHQLNGDGTPYAEDVTIAVQLGVDPRRIDWLMRHEGKVGVASFSFTPSGDPPNDLLLFPE